MAKVYVVSISEHNESAYDAIEDRKIPLARNGVLRIFADKYDAMNYILDYYKETATESATINVQDDEKGFLITFSDSVKELDSGVWTLEGIALGGTTYKITIKVYPMEVTPAGTKVDVDADMYDLVNGEVGDFEICI